MLKPTQDALTERLDRLERENRRLKRLAVAVLLAIGAVALSGQALPRRVVAVIEAERFVLRDAAGKVRAVLGSGFGDEPSLALHGGDGKTRAVLQLLPHSAASLRLADEDGRFRLVLSGGAPGLSLRDENGVVRGDLAVRASGPRLHFFDADWKVVWTAP